MYIKTSRTLPRHVCCALASFVINDFTRIPPPHPLHAVSVSISMTHLFIHALWLACALPVELAPRSYSTNLLPAFDIRSFSFSFAETAHIIFIPFPRLSSLSILLCRTPQSCSITSKAHSIQDLTSTIICSSSIDFLRVIILAHTNFIGFSLYSCGTLAGPCDAKLGVLQAQCPEKLTCRVILSAREPLAETFASTSLGWVPTRWLPRLGPVCLPRGALFPTGGGSPNYWLGTLHSEDKKPARSP